MKEYAKFIWHTFVLGAQTTAWLATRQVRPLSMNNWLHRKIDWRAGRISQLWYGAGPKPDED